MARRRMIDPNIWTSEDVSKLNMIQRLLLIGMFSNADDFGKGRSNPVYLRSTIFPYDDIAVSEIEEGLKVIEKHISIFFYEVDGSKYYKFTNWDKWQTVQKPQESKIPEPPETVENHSGISQESVENDSGLREREEKRKEKEEKRREEREQNDSHSLDKQVIELCSYFETLKPGQSISSYHDFLKMAINTYSYEWIKEALQITVKKKDMFIKEYVERILENWRVEGGPEIKRSSGSKPVKFKAPVNTFNSYDQRSYNIKDLEKKLLGQDEESEDAG